MSVGLIGRIRDESDDVLFADRDFEGAVTDAVEYLTGLGHERIAFLNGSRQVVRLGFGAPVRAEESFKASMKSHGLKPVNMYSQSTVEAGRTALQQLLARHPEITTISPPATEMDGAAARQLIGRLAGLELPPEPRLFRGSLVVRGSSAAPGRRRS